MKKKRKVRMLSDEEEAHVQRGIAADPDNPEWTEEDFKNARPFAEVFPDLAASRRGRGRRRSQQSGNLVAADPRSRRALQGRRPRLADAHGPRVEEGEGAIELRHAGYH